MTKPFARPHAVTGTKALFAISGTARAVDGMADDEGKNLIAERKKLPAQMVCPDTGFHANQARLQIRKTPLHLSARQHLPQNNRTLLVEADEVKRVLADVDADR